MKKSLRYLAGVLVLMFALLTTGCFGDPGANLVGTWSGTISYDGNDYPVTLTLNENYFHKALVVLHGYAFQAKLTVGATGSEVATWVAGVPTNDQMDELIDLLIDYVTNGSTPSQPPEVDVAAWGAVTDLMGAVTANKFLLYIRDVEVPGNTAVPVGLYAEVDGDTMYLDGGNVLGVDVTGLTLVKDPVQ